MLRMLGLCSGSAQACSGSDRVRSPSARVCSPSAQVKAAVAHVRRLKRNQRKGKLMLSLWVSKEEEIDDRKDRIYGSHIKAQNFLS